MRSCLGFNGILRTTSAMLVVLSSVYSNIGAHSIQAVLREVMPAVCVNPDLLNIKVQQCRTIREWAFPFRIFEIIVAAPAVNVLKMTVIHCQLHFASCARVSPTMTRYDGMCGHLKDTLFPAEDRGVPTMLDILPTLLEVIRDPGQRSHQSPLLSPRRCSSISQIIDFRGSDCITMSNNLRL